MDRDVVSDVNANWVAWLEAVTDHVVAGASRRFGPVAAGSAGVPIPLFNQTFVFDSPDPDDLAAAVSWMSDREVPFWVTVPEPLIDEVDELADAIGLRMSEGSTPGMALTPLREVPETPSSEIEIVPLTEPQELEHVAAVTAEAFGAPMGPARALAPAPCSRTAG